MTKAPKKFRAPGSQLAVPDSWLRTRHSKDFLLFVAALLSLALTLAAQAQTAPESKIVARVALLSDPHVNRAADGVDATFKPHFEKVIQQVNSEKVDFVLIAGDLTQSGRPEEFADFKNQIKALQAPVFFIPGNHDVGHKFNSGKADGTVTIERIESYKKTMGAAWFEKEKHGVRVIGITSSLLGSGFPQEKEMWKFLEHELSRPARKPTIVFMHYPLFLKSLDEPGGDYYNIEPEPRKRLYELLRQGAVKTVLTGHLHRTLINRRDGILFLSTEPISFGIPRGKQAEGWTLVTVYASGEVKETIHNLEAGK
jgi:3',5'-cyclic AMP phosphodiesterase CpdA